MQPYQEFVALTKKVLCQVHHTFHPVQGNLWRCTHTRESEVEIKKRLQESYSDRERIFAEHREVRDLLELRAGYAAQGGSKVQTGLSLNQVYMFILNAWNSTKGASHTYDHSWTEKD